MLEPRPCSGPASQPIQPPLRAGTYCEGSPAAPAAVKKTLTTTPSRPSVPSARSAAELGRTTPRPPLKGAPRSDRSVFLGALVVAGAIGIDSLLRLLTGRRVVGNVEFHPTRV